MVQNEKVFKYKLDFYYQSALIYLVTLILYGGIRGNFVEAEFKYVLNDPIMYVIIAFVVMSFVVLALNYIRDRRLVVTDDAMVFRNRWHERRIAIGDIEWMHIGREARVETSGIFQAVVFKLKGKRRVYRVRLGRYERQKELLAEMERFAAMVPRRRARRWRRPGTPRQKD